MASTAFREDVDFWLRSLSLWTGSAAIRKPWPYYSTKDSPDFVGIFEELQDRAVELFCGDFRAVRQ